MQFCTQQMVRDIQIAVNRVKQIEYYSPLRIIYGTSMVTEEDQKNLANDLVKLDECLYWTDLKETLCK